MHGQGVPFLNLLSPLSPCIGGKGQCPLSECEQDALCLQVYAADAQFVLIYDSVALELTLSATKVTTCGNLSEWSQWRSLRPYHRQGAMRSE